MNAPYDTPLRTKVQMTEIMAKCKGTTYTVLPDGRTTICQITLENGYTVDGHSAVVDIKAFNKALGEKYAYEQAIEKIWPLEGYLVAEGMWRAAQAKATLVDLELALA